MVAGILHERGEPKQGYAGRIDDPGEKAGHERDEQDRHRPVDEPSRYGAPGEGRQETRLVDELDEVMVRPVSSHRSEGVRHAGNKPEVKDRPTEDDPGDRQGPRSHGRNRPKDVCRDPRNR